MKSARDALCWAGAMVMVAVAGAAEWIDEASMTTLLIALPAAMLAASGNCSALRRKA